MGSCCPELGEMPRSGVAESGVAWEYIAVAASLCAQCLDLLLMCPEMWRTWRDRGPLEKRPGERASWDSPVSVEGLCTIGIRSPGATSGPGINRQEIRKTPGCN